jgi:hypothetical protein
MTTVTNVINCALRMAHSFVCKYKVEQNPENSIFQENSAEQNPDPMNSEEKNPDDLDNTTWSESINPVQQQRIVEVDTISNLPPDIILSLIEEGL